MDDLSCFSNKPVSMRTGYLQMVDVYKDIIQYFLWRVLSSEVCMSMEIPIRTLKFLVTDNDIDMTYLP